MLPSSILVVLDLRPFPSEAVGGVGAVAGFGRKPLRRGSSLRPRSAVLRRADNVGVMEEG